MLYIWHMTAIIMTNKFVNDVFLYLDDMYNNINVFLP